MTSFLLLKSAFGGMQNQWRLHRGCHEPGYVAMWCQLISRGGVHQTTMTTAAACAILPHLFPHPNHPPDAHTHTHTNLCLDGRSQQVLVNLDVSACSPGKLHNCQCRLGRPPVLVTALCHVCRLPEGMWCQVNRPCWRNHLGHGSLTRTDGGANAACDSAVRFQRWTIAVLAQAWVGLVKKGRAQHGNSTLFGGGWCCGDGRQVVRFGAQGDVAAQVRACTAQRAQGAHPGAQQSHQAHCVMHAMLSSATHFSRLAAGV